MKISIRIEKRDLGFSADSIRSLLSKLSVLDQKAGSLTKDDKFEVRLDFDSQDCNDLSLAILWRFLKHHQNLPCGKDLVYQEKSKDYFDERHFFDSLTGRRSSLFKSSVPINFETFTPIRPKKEDDQNESINKIFSNVTKNIFAKSHPFQNELKVHMVESVQNAFDHSESNSQPAGIVCSLRKSGIMDFCVADMGQGMKKSFLINPALRNEFINLKETEVITRATNKGVSCNPASARNPDYIYPNGGIGLYYLREFVRLHPDSKLVIISGKGYYYIDYLSKLEKTSTMSSPWLGTIVYIRTQLNQEKNPAYIQLADAFVTEFDNREQTL